MQVFQVPEARWAIRNRLTDASKVSPYLSYLHMEAIKGVKPETVSLAGK